MLLSFDSKALNFYSWIISEVSDEQIIGIDLGTRTGRA